MEIIVVFEYLKPQRQTFSKKKKSNGIIDGLLCEC